MAQVTGSTSDCVPGHRRCQPRRLPIRRADAYVPQTRARWSGSPPGRWHVPRQYLVIAVPTDESGRVGSWGRAKCVAVATTEDGEVKSWEECDVGWDVLHDAGSDRAHHARVARFVKDHGVDIVVVQHMGPGMVQMLERMGLKIDAGVLGDARHAVRVAASRAAG